MKTEYKLLCQKVEICFGQPVITARHFQTLSDSIFERTGVLLSATTLKRLWGYLNEDVEPRRHTLDTLSRYAGWAGWEAFCKAGPADADSGPVGRRSLDVIQDLRPGDILDLSWQPDRLCRIRHLGHGEFEVLSSAGTRIAAGDHFRCTMIIEDEPLYLDHLTRGGDDLGVYVCGRKNGVHFRMP